MLLALVLALALLPATAFAQGDTFTVRFLGYDGTELAAVVVTQGQAAIAPEVPVREGYTFAGWDSSFDNVKCDLTVTAIYVPLTFVVRFTDYDGTVLAEDMVIWNTAATAPMDLVRDGYTFAGWDADFSTVTANMTVNAVYEQDDTVIINESVPQGVSGSDDTVVLQDDGIPLPGAASFPWWWILLGGGAAGLVLWLVFHLLKRGREQDA